LLPRASPVLQRATPALHFWEFFGVFWGAKKGNLKTPKNYLKGNEPTTCRIPIQEYNYSMARASTTTDVFNAIAEPRRRQIVDLLAKRGALAVGTLVAAMGLPQPAVSKHLGVLRTVGVVSVTKDGRQRLYQLEAGELKHVHDWVKGFEHLWSHKLDRIKERAERKAKEAAR
jgi:DNA-binding transcriptional ArsR family regulator